MLVPVLDPGPDVGFQRLDGTVVAALQQIGGDVTEKPFDLIDPAGIGRCEMHVESGMLGEPGPHRRGFVGAVIVADQVDIQIGGYFGVDLGQELLELDGAVPSVQARLEITDPSAVLNAANRLVVPCRT